MAASQLPIDDDAERGPFARAADHGLGHELRRGLPLLREPIDDLLVLGGVLGVAAVLVVAGAAHEVGAARVHARQRALRDAVAVDVDVAMERLGGLELLGRQHFAAVGAVRGVPVELAAHPVVHADVEVRHHDDGRLQPVREIERRDGELEALARIGAGTSSTCFVSPCEA